jgi:hypothetical protein
MICIGGMFLDAQVLLTMHDRIGDIEPFSILPRPIFPSSRCITNSLSIGAAFVQSI